MLYIALEQDLRDRYFDSTWLVYGRQIRETAFTSDDIIILSEWSFEEHTELLDVLYHIRQSSGARVIYIGSESSETDEWKRQLVFLGVWDFLFVRDELNLRLVDKLIESPRTAKDVEKWLGDTGSKTSERPQVVDVYDSEEESDLAQAALVKAADELSATAGQAEPPSNLREKLAQQLGAGRQRLTQMLSRTEATVEVPRTATAKTPRIVWTSPKPLKVAIVGTPGVGKSCIAWNLAAVLNLHELPTCIVEPDLQPLSVWSNVEQTHVMTSIPSRGYRVNLVTRGLDTFDSMVNDADIFLVVTFPDPHRIHRAVNWIQDKKLNDRATLVINHHLPGTKMDMDITTPIERLEIPHDIRQLGAIRMHTPLALSDQTVAARFLPVVDRISALFLTRTKGGTANVAPSGV